MATLVRRRAPPSHDLEDLHVPDRPRVEVDPLLERPRQPLLVQCDDPALLDDHLVDHAPVDQSRAQHGRVLPLRRAVLEEHLAPLLGEDFGEAVARGFFRVHVGYTAASHDCRSAAPPSLTSSADFGSGQTPGPSVAYHLSRTFVQSRRLWTAMKSVLTSAARG